MRSHNAMGWGHERSHGGHWVSEEHGASCAYRGKEVRPGGVREPSGRGNSPSKGPEIGKGEAMSSVSSSKKDRRGRMQGRGRQRAQSRLPGGGVCCRLFCPGSRNRAGRPRVRMENGRRMPPPCPLLHQLSQSRLGFLGGRMAWLLHCSQAVDSLSWWLWSVYPTRPGVGLEGWGWGPVWDRNPRGLHPQCWLCS